MLTMVGGGLIERTDLSAQIAAALREGSLLLIAGAGYGKTTALRQALGEAGATAAWVRCGDAGADAGRLLGLILEAVRVASPGAGDALAEELASARAPIDAAMAATGLERELAAVLVEPLVIVFDDAETVTASPAAVEVISRLLLTESPLLRVALASRRRPAIRLARERAMGRITELGPADLSFTASDCAAYVRQLTRRDPDPAVVDTLLHATDGWPLGVALATSGADPATAGPSPAVAHAYFDEEVFAPLDPELRRALLAASIAPDLNVAERAGLGPEHGFAAAVDRNALFVRSSSTTAGGRHELHPLFRDFLRVRFARETPPADQQRAARKIAEALDGLERPIEAVDYYLAAEDWPAAAGAIARLGPPLVRTAADTVAAWIEALPPEHADRPELLLLAGELAHGQGRFDSAIDLCRAAVNAFDKADPPAPAPQRFAARFALADVLMGAADLSGVAALADVLDDPHARGDVLARAVGVVVAAALARQGRFDEARAVFERALDDPSAEPLAGLVPGFAAYYLELPAGRLDDALAHARESVEMLRAVDPTGRLAYALGFLTSILEERGEDAEALEVARQTRAWARRVGLAGWVGVVLAIRSANLRARAGDVAGAEADLADVPSKWPAWGAWEIDATRATLALLRGDGEGARTAAESAARQAESRWPYFDRARCAAMLAPTLARAGHSERARQIVERTIAERTPGFSTARLCAVLAWLRHDEGDEAGSVAALAAAFAEAKDQFAHTVRREWPRLERPIWVALEHGAIDLGVTVAALAAARPGAAALAPFTRHPRPDVRRAALLGAVAAGHPEEIERVPELQRDPDPAVASAATAAVELLRRTPPALSFRLLGGFELRRGTWLVDDAEWERRIAQRVVRLLLCRGRGPVLEDELIEAFWPDKAADSARRSVQVAVSAARAVLDPPGAPASRLVCIERAYRLQLLEQDTVDAEQFEAAAVAALSRTPGTRARRSALLAAANMWTGEPLPEERYAEWSTVWRERLRDRYGEVLAALVDAHEEAGESSRAIAVARQLVQLDPLNEAAHRRLIVIYARTGRRGHALRQFLECRHALVTALAVEPGEETAALQRRVLAGESV